MPEPHAITRARECYGIELTLADVRAIELQCAAGKTLVTARNPDATNHALLFKDVALIAVVGADGKLRTFVPPRRDRDPGKAGFTPRAPKLPPLKARRR